MIHLTDAEIPYDTFDKYVENCFDAIHRLSDLVTMNVIPASQYNLIVDFGFKLFLLDKEHECEVTYYSNQNDFRAESTHIASRETD